MTQLLHAFATVTFIGCGATLVLDTWVSLLKRFGVKTLDFALIGRWIGHLFYGKFAHASIREAQPIPAELALGWLTHYAVGVLFAGVLVSIYGQAWVAQPSLAPALLIGICSVAAPFFVMQPAMGSGIASSRTPTPFKNALRSVINHAVFGLGLYLTANVVRSIGQ